MAGTEHQEPTFDRVGLSQIGIHWWQPAAAAALSALLRRLLAPGEGSVWIGSPVLAWTEVNEDNWTDASAVLDLLASVWSSGYNHEHDYYQALRERGSCTVFMDAPHFRALLEEPEALPDHFYLAYQVDWEFNPDAGGVILTPHVRIHNRWPVSEMWAPPAPDNEVPARLSASEAATLLEDGFANAVLTRGFRSLQDDADLFSARIDLDGRSFQPTVFYFASPTDPPGEAEEYLKPPYLRAFNTLGPVLLGTPDMRSTEVPGGVLEGCLAVFNHSPTLQSEYCLLVPLAGFEAEDIEKKIHFVTYKWHEIDLDATWEVYDITTDLEEEQQFNALWRGSVDSAMKLHETLFSLLRKVSIQPRMFALAQLLNVFLANLHTRSYASAKKRAEFQRKLEASIAASRKYAQSVYTVRPIPGVELLESVSDGYTRAYRSFEKNIASLVDSGNALSVQIEEVSKSLSYTASLEEERQERERKVLMEREERAAKRLNLVLALVAVLAAIPLIVGQFDSSTLASAITWFPFRMGLHFSFWIALVAFFATLGAIVLTLWSGKAANPPSEDAGLLATVSDHADTLFDAYRTYEHPLIRGALLHVRRADSLEDPGVAEAVKVVHDFDVSMARSVASAVEQANAWGDSSAIPETDDAWARSIEERVCRFVLLSDAFDLRPESLHLPVTLCFYRLKYSAGGLGHTPVSDWDFQQAMRFYGFDPDDIQHIESWAVSEDVANLSPTDFVDACVELGIGVGHRFGGVTSEV